MSNKCRAMQLTLAYSGVIMAAMDKLQAMTVFVKIAEAGSLTAAANELGRSLPAVVRMLAELEKALNVRLLNRTTRKIALTGEGRMYLERCRRILAEIEETELALTNDQVEPSGTITLTAPVRFGEIHVGPLVNAFLKKYPRIQINLLLLDRVVDMLEEGIDLAVRIAHTGDSLAIAKPIGELRRVVCASPEIINAFGWPQRPEDLSELPCVVFSGISNTGVWSFRNGAKRTAVKVNGQFTCNQVQAAVDACAAGLGFGKFLSYQVLPCLRNGALSVVLEEFEEPAIPVNLVFQHTRLMPSRIRILVDYLAAELKHSLSAQVPLPA